MTRRICVFVAVASFALMTQILSLLPQNKKNLALAFAFMPSLYTRHSACVCECASVNTSTHLHALHLCGHKMACVYGGVYISVCACVSVNVSVLSQTPLARIMGRTTCMRACWWVLCLWDSITYSSGVS